MEVGARVLAQWPVEMEWWYPATIVSIEGGQMEAIYDDGDRASLTADQLKPLAIGVGSRVYGNWKGGGTYYPGRVDEVTGDAVSIAYDDGDRETTVIRMLRINQADL